MDATEFAANVALNLPYEPNSQQLALLGALARFCTVPIDNLSRQPVFVLNGYAGTGKTSLMGALVRTLPMVGLKCVLLAPTGRAAKVFGGYAARQASTIHRRIYRHFIQGVSRPGAPMQAENTAKDTIFIVDEASMIGGSAGGGESLIHDLVQYVYSGDNCRLILLGDTAQLPPVGSTHSPAMNADFLRSLGLKVSRVTLTETARQARDSGILWNATALRRLMAAGGELPLPRLRFQPFTDVVAVSPEDLPEMLDRAYRTDGIDQTVVVTRSNRTATDFNRGIRNQVLYYEEELRPDELLVVAKNNYTWTRKVKGIDFIANGDTLVVRRVLGTEQRWGFRFADVVLSPVDSEVEFTAKILLETLSSESPALSQERSNELYYALMQDPEVWPEGASIDERLRLLATNDYWNALQVKYAYAVTCHKAQGGQWQNVFVDMSYLPADATGTELYRWLYTAITRARKRLYIIGAESAD